MRLTMCISCGDMWRIVFFRVNTIISIAVQYMHFCGQNVSGGIFKPLFEYAMMKYLIQWSDICKRVFTLTTICCLKQCRSLSEPSLLISKGSIAKPNMKIGIRIVKNEPHFHSFISSVSVTERRVFVRRLGVIVFSAFARIISPKKYLFAFLHLPWRISSKC